jgi:hypothetical protein
MAMDKFQCISAVKRELVGEQFVKSDAKGVKVCPVI